MMKGAAACHLSLQHGLTGGDKVLHLVHGDIGDLQEREGDCRPVHGPPASAGASVPRRPRGPLIGINSTPQDLARRFSRALFPRTTNQYGCVTLHSYHFSVEAGLPQTRVL